jgi:hypothetical protein
MKLKKWDGTTDRTWHIYPVEEERPLYIDDEGNVYSDDRGDELWCAADRLIYHLTRLYKLGIAK